MADNKNEAPEDLGAPVSYMVLAEGTPVWDRAGDRVGTVEHVLADDREDVFHGLIIKTHDGHRYASSAQVDGIFELEPMCMQIVVSVSWHAWKKGSQ